MNTRNNIFVLVFLFLFVQSAYAADWELLAESNDQQFYIDTNSIEYCETTCLWCIRCSSDTGESCLRDLPKHLVRVWTKKILKHPEKYQEREELDFQEYACEKGMKRMLHATRIYADGRNYSVNLNVVLKWEAIASDSMSTLVKAYLCNKI